VLQEEYGSLLGREEYGSLRRYRNKAFRCENFLNFTFLFFLVNVVSRFTVEYLALEGNSGDFTSFGLLEV